MNDILTKEKEEKIPLFEIKMKKEYNMSPTGPQHNKLCLKIYSYLNEILSESDYDVLIDVYKYLDEDTINLFGNFKNSVGTEIFISNLQRFGAPKKLIEKKLHEYAGTGVAQGIYAPDVFVIRKDDVYERFSIPLLAFEVISDNSLENDLYFKPYFYETIGVQEYYICQSTRTRGTIIKAYHLVMDRYEEKRLEKQGYFSEVLLNYIPQVWQM